MAVSSEFDANLYIGVTGTNGGGLLGLAPMGSLCNSGKTRRINMNQFAAGSQKNGVAYTAEVRTNNCLSIVLEQYKFMQ